VMFGYSPSKLTTDYFLGVDRGINNLAAWSVVNEDGHSVTNGAIEGETLRYTQQRFLRQRREIQARGKIVRGRRMGAYGDEAVHVTANALIEAAVKHNARLVLEDLSNFRRVIKRPKFTPRSNFNVVLGRQQYQKLLQVLTYKAAVAGLPAPLFVGAAYTSQTCLECGHVAKENRTGSCFHCVACGHAADADVNAARVIALKGAWLSQLPTWQQRDGRDLREDERFPAYVIDAARRRLGSSVAPSW